MASFRGNRGIRRPGSSTSLPELDSSAFTLPLQISSAVCSAASLLLLLTALCTSSWLMEKSSAIHSGLWVIYRGPEFTVYGFRSLATFIHVTRGLLVAATFLGILSLSFICLSFQRTYLGRVSLIATAATLSFSAGLVTMISMSVFTVSYRRSDKDIQQLTSFGSSYHLGWTSSAMYFLTVKCCAEDDGPVMEAHRKEAKFWSPGQMFSPKHLLAIMNGHQACVFLPGVRLLQFGCEFPDSYRRINSTSTLFLPPASVDVDQGT
ncbi:hypothetical protein lerEdw1_009748 [Lerista edwardsae]|nr:hypothetical protein lerEdw1_009748 [Lerista edwardsae]